MRRPQYTRAAKMTRNDDLSTLRAEGKHEEADKALAEFRKRFPDYKIPEEMLRRVERR